MQQHLHRRLARRGRTHQAFALAPILIANRGVIRFHRYSPMKEGAMARTDTSPPYTTTNLSKADKLRLVTMLKAIGHPMRFDILQFLIANPNCYTKDIVAHLPISQATVSQHIKQLREAGWLASEAVCQMTSHWIDQPNVEWFKEIVGEVF